MSLVFIVPFVSVFRIRAASFSLFLVLSALAAINLQRRRRRVFVGEVDAILLNFCVSGHKSTKAEPCMTG